MVQHVTRRRDRIAAVDQRLAGQARGRDASQRESLIPIDDAIFARFGGCRRYPVLHSEAVTVFAVAVSRVERTPVGFGDLRHTGELPVEPLLAGLNRAIVEPAEQSEREEILAAALLPCVDIDLLEGGHGQ